MLSPKWWVGHVLVALAAFVFVALGEWQYDRSQSAVGDFQNLGYALQWPLFAVFAVFAWWRVLRLEQLRLEQLRAGGEPSSPTPEPSPPPRPALHDSESLPKPYLSTIDVTNSSRNTPVT